MLLEDAFAYLLFYSFTTYNAGVLDNLQPTHTLGLGA